MTDIRLLRTPDGCSCCNSPSDQIHLQNTTRTRLLHHTVHGPSHLDLLTMPDLNSVPESPRVLALSRRTSSAQMPPPSAPASASSPSDAALNILPSNLNAVTTGAPIAPSLPSPILASANSAAQRPADASSATAGPGPVRHPRPLTAADLHQQLEKEQEAVVCYFGASAVWCLRNEC